MRIWLLYLWGRFFRFYSKKSMSILWWTIDVTKCSTIWQILGNKTYLVNWVMIKTILQGQRHISESWRIYFTNWMLTPVFSSLIFNPSTAMWIKTLCLCSPEALIAVLSSSKASWHILSPRASFKNIENGWPIAFFGKVCLHSEEI